MFTVGPMWHLILPPVVVVLCLAFALWYLALRGSDPKVAEEARLIRDEVEASPVKAFFFRILEKLAQRFKVFSLKMHNVLNGLTKILREKRERFANGNSETVHLSEAKPDSSPEWARPETPLVSSEVRPDRVSVSESANKSTVEPFDLLTPLERRSRREKEERIGMTESKKILATRPMLVEKETRPDRAPKKSATSRAVEEEMIARIAVNPKDHTAYEALGDYYMEAGNIQDAKECYKQVLKLSPVHRMVKIKIRRLEKLLSQKTES